MRRRGCTVAALLIAGAFAGCAGTSDAVRRNDDGTLNVQCSGGYHDWSRCHERAAAACRPDGFEIVSQVSNEGSSGVGSRDWSAAGSEVSRVLVVRCT